MKFTIRPEWNKLIQQGNSCTRVLNKRSRTPDILLKKERHYFGAPGNLSQALSTNILEASTTIEIRCNYT